jgi:hypothetical protein
MLKFSTIIVLLSIMSLGAIAQTTASYYVNEYGDTIHGHFAKMKGNKVDFTPHGGASAITLKSKNCRYVFIDESHIYIPYSGKRLINPVKWTGSVSLFNASSPGEKRSVSGFLKKIASTKYCEFYSYSDEVRLNLFYGVKGKAPQELICEVNIYNNVMNEVNAYKDQLKQIFSDPIATNDNLAKMINSMNYTEEDIISLANAINATK